jgi:hypothetical protein
MTTMNRRKFLTVAGAGTAAVAVGAAAIATGSGLLAGTGKQSTLTFKAVAGLPAKPLPHYCTYVIEGHLDLTAKSGSVTETMFAGYPEAMSDTVWTGFSRIVRVTGVRQMGGALHVTGAIADRSQLRTGESATFQLQIDRAAHTAQGEFMGKPISLTLT